MQALGQDPTDIIALMLPRDAHGKSQQVLHDRSNPSNRNKKKHI